MLLLVFLSCLAAAGGAEPAGRHPASALAAGGGVPLKAAAAHEVQEAPRSVSPRWLQQRELANTICLDEPVRWRSTFGSSCQDYVDNKWCTASGGYGEGWSCWWCTFADFAVAGLGADQACCGCGAGDPEGTFTRSSTSSTSTVTVTATSTATTISETSSSTSTPTTTSETSSTSHTSTATTSSATSESWTSSTTRTTSTRTTTSETTSSTATATTTSESSTSTTSGTTTTRSTTSETSSGTSTVSTVTATTTTGTTTTPTTTSETSTGTSTVSTVTGTTTTVTTTTPTTTSETSSGTSTVSSVTVTTTTGTTTTPTTTSESSSTSVTGTTITSTSTTPTTTSETSSTSATSTSLTSTSTTSTTVTQTTTSETSSTTSATSTASTVTATSITTTTTTTTSETSSVTVPKCNAVGLTADNTNDEVVRFEIIVTEVDAKAALTDGDLAADIVTVLADYVANKISYAKEKLYISLCDGSLVAIVEVDVLGVEDPYGLLLPLKEDQVSSDILQLLQGIQGFEGLSSSGGNVDAGIVLPTTTLTSTTRTNPPLLAIPVNKEESFDRAVVSGGFQLFLVDGGVTALDAVEDAVLEDAYEEAIRTLIPKAKDDAIAVEITWNETQDDHYIQVMYTFTVTGDDFRADAAELMDELLAASAEEVAAAFQPALAPLLPGGVPPEILTASVSIPGVVEEFPEAEEVDLAKALAGAIAGAAVMASAGASAASSGASAATSAMSGDGGAGASAGGGTGGAAGGVGTGAENGVGGVEGADVDAGVEAEGELEAEAEGGEEEENEQKAPKMKPVHGNYMSPNGDIFVVGAWSSLPLIGLCYGAHKVMVTHPSTGRQFLLEKGFGKDKNFRDRDGETQLKVHSDSVIECAGVGKLQRQKPWWNGYLVFLAPAILILASLLIILIQYMDAGEFEFSLTPFALMGSACVSLGFVFFVKPGSFVLKAVLWVKNYPPRAIRDDFWRALGSLMAFMPAIPAFFVGLMTGNILGYIIAGVVSMFGLLAPFGSWVFQYFMTLVKLATSFSLSGVCLYFSVLDVGNIAVFVPAVLFYLMAVGEWVESKTFDNLPYEDVTEVITDGIDLDGLGQALDLSKAHMNALLILKQGKKLLDQSAQFLLLEGSKIMIIGMVRGLIFGIHTFSENFVAHGFGKMQEGMEDKTGDVGQAIANQDTSVSPKAAGRRMLDAMKTLVTTALEPFVSVAKKAKEEMTATIEKISEGLSRAQTFIPIDVFHIVTQAKGVRSGAGKVREVARDLERELDECPEKEVTGEEAAEAYRQSTRVKTMISRLVTEVDSLRHHHDKAVYSSNKNIETGFERINKEIPEIRHETVELLINMQEACARIVECVEPLDIIYKEDAASFARRMALKSKEVFRDEEEDVLELSFDIPLRKVDSAKFIADLHMEFDRLGADQKQLRTTLREGSTIATTRGPVTQISGLKATPLNDLEMMGQKARVVPQLREVTDGTCLRAMRATPVYTIFEERTRIHILDEESHGFIREITEGEFVVASGWPIDINGLFWVPIKPKGAVQLSTLEMASPNLEFRTMSRREAEYYRDQLTLLYAARCPEHMGALPSLLQRYEGHEDRLYAIACERYGKEPFWYDKAMYPDKSLPLREVSCEGSHGAMARGPEAEADDPPPAGGVVLEELQEVTKSVKTIESLQEQIESSIMGSDNTFIIGEIVLATLAGLAVGGLAAENAEPLMNSVMAMKDLFSAAGEALLELEAVQFVFEMVMEYGEDALDAGMDAIANMTEVFESDVAGEAAAEEVGGGEAAAPVLVQEGVHGALPPTAASAAGSQEADGGGAWSHTMEEQQDDEAWRASQTSSRTWSTHGPSRATGSGSTKGLRRPVGSPLSRREAGPKGSVSSRSMLGRRSQSLSGRRSQPLASPMSAEQSPRSQRSQREFEVGELVETGRGLHHVDTEHPDRSYAVPKGTQGAVVRVAEDGVTVAFETRGEVCLLPEDAQQLMQVGKAVKDMKVIAGGFVAATPPALFFALEQFTMGTLQISLAAIESMILGCVPGDLDVPMNNTAVEVEVEDEEEEEEGSDSEDARSPRKASVTEGGADERHPQDLYSQTLGSANADDSMVSCRRSLGSDVAITDSV